MTVPPKKKAGGGRTTPRTGRHARRTPDPGKTPWAHRSKLQGDKTKPMQLVGRNHAALHQVAHPITVWGSDDLNLLVRRMFATLSVHADGLALAAPQVGRPLRLVVVNDRKTETGIAIANPVVKVGGRRIVEPEGCLSIPGRWFEVPRFQHCVVVGYDPRNGTPIGCDAVDLMARMWQHEIDHLDGKLLLGRFPETRLPAPEPDDEDEDEDEDVEAEAG